MKVRFLRSEGGAWLEKGKVYDAYHSAVTGDYYVIDASKEARLRPAEDFEIVEEY